jgi:hypothetical protein
MNTFRFPLVLFLSSFILMIVFLLFKIMHWPGGGLLVGSMLMVQLTAIIWLIVIILKPAKKQ